MLRAYHFYQHDSPLQPTELSHHHSPLVYAGSCDVSVHAVTLSVHGIEHAKLLLSCYMGRCNASAHSHIVCSRHRACKPMLVAEVGACLHQIQICSLSDIAGWQAQSSALQQIGIDFFAEAKEASTLRTQSIMHCCTMQTCCIRCAVLCCGLTVCSTTLRISASSCHDPV